MRDRFPATVTEKEALEALERKRKAVLRAAAARRGASPDRIVYNSETKDFEIETSPSP